MTSLQPAGDDDATVSSIAYQETAEFSEHFAGGEPAAAAPRRSARKSWLQRMIARVQAERKAPASSLATENWNAREERQDFADPHEE